MELKNMIWVGLGGMLGALARYFFGLAIKSDSFPYATGLVNIIGALIMGVVMGLTLKGQISPTLRLFLATGICGGFTTFSAFAYNNFIMIKEHSYGQLLFNVGGNIFLGILAVYLGIILIRVIF